jgi:hypothetical protein
MTMGTYEFRTSLVGMNGILTLLRDGCDAPSYGICERLLEGALRSTRLSLDVGETVTVIAQPTDGRCGSLSLLATGL